MTTTVGRPEVWCRRRRGRKGDFAAIFRRYPAIFRRFPIDYPRDFPAVLPTIALSGADVDEEGRAIPRDFPAPRSVHLIRSRYLSPWLLADDDDGYDEERPPSAARASLPLTTTLAGADDELTGAGREGGGV
ncbi:hypothetical protein TIFTF001_002983 [Ficus carica]|uniref:Uncharacterized protein n=1 Tax=Ficus carica TaxID=3494 RepID=A0AA87ZD89_FICCA|nr:hypothetical protein TIFTF001_002983 [Ficus carica]